MSQNYNQGSDKNPKKPKINEWCGEGIVQSRGGDPNEEIKFFPFKNGGGAIHITVACVENIGADDQGRPKTQTCYVPVSVMTNRLITQQQLQSIRAGMKVKIVGKLAAETYTSKKDGQKKTTLVVNAYVFEVLQMPQQTYGPQGGYQPQPGPGYAPLQQGYGPQGGQPYYPPQSGYPAPGAPQGGYGPQPGYQPQGGYPAPGAPHGGQQTYPAQGGGYPGPQPGYGYGPAAPAAPAPAGNVTPPPYYNPPQGSQHTTVEDLP